MKNIEALKRLNGYCCTDNYWSMGGLFPSFVYTDGAKALATNAEAYWLLTEIAAAQKDLRKDPRLNDMQFWYLRKKGDSAAELICERDQDDVAFRKEIPYTDMPFEAFDARGVRLWVQRTAMGENMDKEVMCCLLPSEY